MGTTIRPELSKKNKYWISKHRYYELRHFCLQYPEWKERYQEIVSHIPNKPSDDIFIHEKNCTDGTGKAVDLAEPYFEKMAVVEQCAKDTDEQLWQFILEAVTTGKSFAYFQTVKEIPCSKDTFYDRYRRFFWLLDKRT